MAEDPNAGGGGDAPLSQADIDAALAAAGGGAETPSEPAGDDGLLSQADIDAALAGGSGAAEPAAGGDVGQAEIDAMLAAAGGGGEAGADSGDIDQAEIDAMLAGAGGGDSAAESGGLTQEDIDAALAGGTEPADERLDSCGRPFDEAAAAMAAAIEEEKAAAAAAAAAAAPVGAPVDLPDFSAAGADGAFGQKIDLLHNVNLRVKIELGRTRMLVEDVLKLGDGSVVELNKLAGDPVDVFANDRLIARGEVLVLNDNFCVRVSEIISDAAAQALEA